MTNDKNSAATLMADAKFLSDYARFNDETGQYESWDEAVERVMNMHRTRYAVQLQSQPTLDAWFTKIEDCYKQKRFLGAQRALQFGGEQMLKKNARLYNCFDVSTRFVTVNGVKSFADFNDGDNVTVLTHKNRWQRAVVKSYGKQKLNRISFQTSHGGLQNAKEILATANHRWLLVDGSETTNLRVDNRLHELRSQPFDYYAAEPLERLYWCYGYVFGDGTKVKDANGAHTYSMVRLCRQGKDVEQYLERFTEMGFPSSASTSLNGDVMVYTGKYLKTTPDLNKDAPELVKAFVWGYLAADGTKNNTGGSENNPYLKLQSSDQDHIEFFRKAAPVAGIHIIGEKDLTGKVTNFAPEGRRPTILFNIRNDLNSANGWKVTNIEENLSEAEVWCLEVEEDHSFVLEGGLVTGNCVSSYVDRPAFFGEYMWLMLCGCGAGFSVQKHHVAKLPDLKVRKKSVKKHVVEDSIEGWAKAFDVLFSSFFVGGGKHPEFEGHPVWFDLSKIRPKGAYISGGFKAPGPEPLQYALNKVESLLTKAQGPKLRPIEIYDACMYMADAVISGGVRRSATICLFSKDDEEMIKAKTGNWFSENPQRGRSNNSVMLLRDEVTFEEFQKIMESVEHSGEPGFIFTDNLEFTFNPLTTSGLSE